jgi:N-acetylglucosamine-6-phosphate deacetylase
MIFENVLVVDPIDGEFVGSVETTRGVISEVKRGKKSVNFEYILMPGFADPHTHGSAGVDALSMDLRGLKKWESFLYSQGVTYFLPTTMSSTPGAILSSAKVVREYLENNDSTSVGGIHYEGPYINVKRKGAQNPSLIRKIDLGEIESTLIETVRLITMAPELEGFIEASKLITDRGIPISLGHTDASYEDMKRAFEAGCTRVTHFPNGMNTLHHRELGCIGAVFSMPFSVEMIIDGVHSLPQFVKMVYDIKGPEWIMIVTDTIDAAGMPDGEYELGGLKVILKNGRPTLEDGTIAATVLMFNQAVRNFKSFTGCTLKDLACVSSYNSLRLLGIEDRGRIAGGYLANLVLLDRNLKVVETVLNGKTVFKS